MMRVRNLSKAYGGKMALNGISTDFPAQRITALIGPNGAGKSTLLMLMARLLKADGGEVLLGERNIARIRTADYARHVATLRQSPGFNLRLTVEELVAFGRFPHNRGALTAADRHAVDAALAFLSLQALRHAYIENLSGGQRQMAFLAMTIAQQTPVLLLDEPLNHLDIRHAVHLMQALRRLCDEEKRTVVVVMHDINFAANYADHIVALKDGTLHASGSTREVMTEARLADLYGLNVDILRHPRGCLCNYYSPLAISTVSTPSTGAAV